MTDVQVPRDVADVADVQSLGATEDSDCMLTTLDNPYNPFTNFSEWNAFDRSKGYNTCAYLARVAVTSDELSDKDNALATIDAIDSIVDSNVTGNYIKVYKDTFSPRLKKDMPVVK